MHASMLIQLRAPCLQSQRLLQNLTCVYEYKRLRSLSLSCTPKKPNTNGETRNEPQINAIELSMEIHSVRMQNPF